MLETAKLNSSPDVSRQNAQKSVSPYDRYPDTAVALSQLAIKPRLCAKQRESEFETNESEAETQKTKRAWVAPPKGWHLM